ncbi:MAG: Mu-like prophage major head subunit gpT family protein [Thalassobaculaceae bacterium]
MLINAQNLRTIQVGFKATFQGGLAQAESQHAVVAMSVPSSSSSETYGWLGQIPGMRKWVGDRVIHGLQAHDYSIVNEDFELTVGVDRNDIADDRLGIYSPMFSEMGRAAEAHKDELVWGLLKAGFTTPCYDGQYFFDTDHPVLDAQGNPTSVSNTGGGSGAPWFLIDDSRAIKPVILQNRKENEFVSKDALTDDNVFHKKTFLYGVDARRQVGFGLWQLAYGSKQTLDAANYEAARLALTGQKGDFGRPLAVMGKKLIVGPSNEGPARKLIENETKANGETNEWRGTADVVVVPWLA